MTAKVIDSSVLARFFLKEAGWDQLEEIMLERPYTLNLAIKEVANAIWRRAKLIGDLSEEKLSSLLDKLIDAKRYLLRVEPQEPYLKQAFKISSKFDLTIYDSLFIALAHSKRAVFITTDKKQHEIASKLGVSSILI